MDQSKILEVKSLSKIFKTKKNEFKAVDNISFHLHKGEILGLLGPNGAGKTTTIQMLLGLLTATHGSISYFGKELNDYPEEILEHVNFASSYTNFPWGLRVKEILHYTAYLYDIPSREERIKKITEMFRLYPLYNKEISSLSAGQQTRLNLAKAFLNFPKVLLLDEPTAALDPESANYIRKFIINQQKEFQVSILFTSHNMPEVEEVCDRVIFIKDGKIIAEDKPENLPKLVKSSRLELTMIDGLKRTIELCGEQNLPHQVKKRAIEIEIDEKKIAYFLNTLAQKKIEYDQISIRKPTLEDFFLEVARPKK